MTRIPLTLIVGHLSYEIMMIMKIKRARFGSSNYHPCEYSQTSVNLYDNVFLLEIQYRYNFFLKQNGYLILDYGTYVHCFTNWLMGKNPNGPGQWVLVPPKDSLPQPPFPVDYSALNTEPAKLEPYAPDKKTNRHSVIV